MSSKRVKKSIKRFVVGVAFTIVIFVCLRLFEIHTAPITLANVLSILFLGGCVGELSAIFNLDINFSLALLLHFLCTLAINVFIFVVNGWWSILVKGGLTIFLYFLVTYLLVWLVLKLNQRKRVNKINQVLKERGLRNNKK